MKRHLFTIVMLVGLAVSAGVLSSCSTKAEGIDLNNKPRKIRLTFPHTLSREHPVHQAIMRFAEDVQQMTRGEVEIRVYEGDTIGNEKDIADEVARGNYDMTKVSSAILADRVELAKIFSMPYLFRNRGHMWAVLDGPIGSEMLEMSRGQGLLGLCYYDAGFRSFYSRNTPIESPEDLEDLTVRVQRSSIMAQLVQTFGARPVPIQFSDLNHALLHGNVLCAENNIPSYYSEKHYQQAPYFSFDEHVAIPDVVLISEKSWQRLRPDIREVLVKAAADSSRFQRDIWEESERTAMEKLRAAGVTFTYPEKQPFVEKAMPIYEEIDQDRLLMYVRRIRELGAASTLTEQTAEAPPAMDVAAHPDRALDPSR
jgi:tripartite ATP-independent transporter DctP family solute receptor